MRITDVETIVTDVDGALILVVVHTDDGLFGVSEAGLRSRQYAVVGALEHIKTIAVGADPFDTERFWQTVARSGFYPIDRVIASALSAVDIAMWDLKGKRLGLPVWKMLGGAVREKVQCYRHVWGRDDAELVDAAARVHDEGWDIVRVVAPSQAGVVDPRTTVRDSIRTLELLRDRIGESLRVILDVHTRLELADAVTLCQELEPLDMFFVEDPLRWENTDVYRELRNRTSVPVAAGEQAANKWELRSLIERDLIDYARFDPCIAGGLTESKKIAGWCEAHSIRTAAHNPLGPVATAAAFQLSMSSPAFGVQEQYQLPGTAGLDAFPTQMRMESQWMLPMELPGLGLEVDLDAARSRPAMHRPVPRLHREDGAFSNW